MSAKLIYHTPESCLGGVSPFDTAVTEMLDGHDVAIACPYLGLTYLQRMIDGSERWRVLTDVEEWLASHGGASRDRIVAFILDNRERVRHCKDLHAKVLLAGNRALTGSANFTEKGITGRVEVSVLFEDCEQVSELRAWYELLWDRTQPVEEGDLRACVGGLPQPTSAATRASLPSTFAGVQSRLGSDSTISESHDAENDLVERLRQAPDRAWAEGYLNLAKQLVDVTGLDGDDPRLVMSLPQGKSLPPTINRRYVLTAFRLHEAAREKHWLFPEYVNPPGHAVVELILPASMTRKIDTLPGVIRHSSFDLGFSGETKETVPRFVSFDVASGFDFGPEVLEGWGKSLLSECDHGRASPFRKSHSPTVYLAVTDLAYRGQLLDRAFGPATHPDRP